MLSLSGAGTGLFTFKLNDGTTDSQCGAHNLVSKGDRMKNKTAIQDYLFCFALVFKTIAIFITWYALDRYACLLYERNPLTRFLLQRDFAYVFVQLAVFTSICIGYSMVRREFLLAYRERTIRYSFNALVGFVFLTYLWDAANDTIILLVASLS
jgi:hypothetical protein